MFLSVNALKSFSCTDMSESSLKVEDFVFSPNGKSLRYISLNLGKWFSSEQLFASLVDVSDISLEHRSIRLNLEIEKLREKSNVLKDIVTIEQEAIIDGASMISWTPMFGAYTSGSFSGGDMWLFSDLSTYFVNGTDGFIGWVQDFIVDTESWVVRDIVVEGKGSRSQAPHLVPTAWLDLIDWVEMKFDVHMRKDMLRVCPEFIPYKGINAEVATSLYDYFGRRREDRKTS